jgi:hypothetical protein
LPRVIKAIFIPYSLPTISAFYVYDVRQLKYAVFEFGSELQSITDLEFASSGITSLFFPASVRVIGYRAFAGC